MNSYEILGVQPSATVDELKSAFRRRAKLCHPDMREDKERAAAEFRELSKAYEHALSKVGSGSGGWSNARKQQSPFQRYEYDPGASDDELRKAWMEQARREREAKEERRRRAKEAEDARAPLLGAEEIRIATMHVGSPSMIEVETGSWERPLFLAEVPNSTDVYVSVVAGYNDAVTVKIPRGTTNGQRFRVRHPRVQGTELTIRVLHDKGKGQ